jgi:APA family basic amino acid/polyamine antiporter
VAWIIGWDLVLEFAVGSAAVSTGWSEYLQTVLSYIFGGEVKTTADVGGLSINWGALLLITVLAVVLAVGTKLSSRVSMVITGIKVAIVLFVIVLGLFYVKGSNYSPYVPPGASSASASTGVDQTLFSWLAGGSSSAFGIFGLLAGASLVFFAFIGFDVVATTAEETKDPKRAVPRGILGSLAIVTVLYVATSLVVTGMVKYTDLATGKDGEHKTLATAFALNHVDWAANIISFGALAGLTTVVMVLMLGQVRVLFAMSRDGLLPRGLARTGERGTPVRATILVGAIVAAAATFFPAGKLEEMVNVGTLFAFILVSAGVMILRRTHPELPRAFRVPALPVIGVAAIVACVWLMLNLTILTWLRFFVWMVIGVVVYFAYSRSHSKLGLRNASAEDAEPKATSS